MLGGDRAHERRSAAALARHYRDAEGLSIREISRRLGRAEATVKAYLYDPTGEKAQAVKARYQRVRRGCGPTPRGRKPERAAVSDRPRRLEGAAGAAYRLWMP
jgi:transposase